MKHVKIPRVVVGENTDRAKPTLFSLQNDSRLPKKRRFSMIFSCTCLLFVAAFSLCPTLLFSRVNVSVKTGDGGKHSSPFFAFTRETYAEAKYERKHSSEATVIEKNGVVEHLFTHNLISHPEIAFSKGNAYGKNLDEDCLTPKEFRAILECLYENDYVLVNANETYEIKNGKAERKAFFFPKGKKPLILSFDDVVYARKNHGKGTSDRLDCKNGKIVAVTLDKDGNENVHGEEFAPILEDFIEKHPDFSHNNARGIIFLTGFDGILGYRTDRENPKRKEEQARVAPVIAQLKARGWQFGCHSYAHAHIKKRTAEQIENDVQKWKNEVEILVGSTPYYAYPYGEWVFGENGEDERQKSLENAGFEVFFGVGNRYFYSKMPLNKSDKKYLFQDRCPMDGIALRKGLCDRFFDCAAIYDEIRPISHI